MNLILHKPDQPVSGTLQLPGSKSISNRVLMIRALSGLQFEIHNLSDSDDTQHLLKALHEINNSVSTVIDIGHAGTDMRFLTAYLSITPGRYELTGSTRIQQRPVKDLVDTLKSLGAAISYKDMEGYPPLSITGKHLAGGKATIRGNVSSQFISALLLTAPYFQSGLELILEGELVSRPYIEMTISIMKVFGARVTWQENRIVVMPGAYTYKEKAYAVQPDWSAASYLYSLVALSPVGTRLNLPGVRSSPGLQPDAICCSLYRQFGVQTDFSETGAVISKIAEPELQLMAYNFIGSPDIAQTLACTCVALNVPFHFTGLATLKIKETDRITALKNELKKCGAEVEVTKETISFNGVTSTAEVAPRISTYHDHRMAMSFAPLALIFPDLEIEQADVVSKSYPLFWQHLQQIGMNIKREADF